MLFLLLEQLPCHSHQGHNFSLTLSFSYFYEALLICHTIVWHKKLGNYLCTTTVSLMTIITILLYIKLLSPHSRRSNNFSISIIYLELLVEYHLPHPKVTVLEWLNGI